MITSFEVGSVFRILDEASPALRKILAQVRELNKAIDGARANLAKFSEAVAPGIAGDQRDRRLVSSMGPGFGKRRCCYQIDHQGDRKRAGIHGGRGWRYERRGRTNRKSLPS
jgi:hypothetical protein